MRVRLCGGVQRQRHPASAPGAVLWHRRPPGAVGHWHHVHCLPDRPESDGAGVAGPLHRGRWDTLGSLCRVDSPDSDNKMFLVVVHLHVYFNVMLFIKFYG